MKQERKKSGKQPELLKNKERWKEVRDMSDEFRKESEQNVSMEQNTDEVKNEQQKETADAAARETVQTNGETGGVHAETDAGQQDGSRSSATTYSWVNPKLTGGTEQQDNSAAYTGQTEQTQQDGLHGSQQFDTNRQGDAQQHRSYQSYHIDMPQAENINQKKKKDRKVKKPMSLGKKWGMVLAMGAVFGIVAGSVFTGTAVIGTKLTGTGNTQSSVTIPTTATNTSSVQDSSATGTGMSVKDVAASAMPSLVAISTMTVEEVQTFFGVASQEVPASGTGVIVGQNDDELLIATNNHVVSGAQQLSVTFTDDTTIEGQIKGTDEANDLAVVAVKLSDIPEDTQSQIKVAVMGDSDALEVGEQVVAIGNALGSGQSVTSGYVSALNRDITSTDETTGQESTSEDLIQTDAAINPGNSGGALLNMNGELIGINEAKYSSTEVEGMGFAIPISKAEPILQNLMSLTTRYKVDDKDASYIGITMQDVESSVSETYGIPSGVRIESVVEGGPADEAGVKKGDILTKFDGRTVTNANGLKDILSYYAAGETVDITVERADDGEYKEKTLTITLGSADDMPQTTPTQQNSLNPFGK